MDHHDLVRLGIHFSLDTPEAVHLQGEKFYLAGWFFADDSTYNHLFLETQDGLFPVYTGISRPDVANHLETALAANCGWMVRFPAPAIERIAHLKIKTDKQDIILAENIPIPFDSSPLPSPEERRPAVDYQDWLVRMEPPLFGPETWISTQLTAFPTLPRIALLLHVENDSPYLLSQCLLSILRQHYTNWELLILNQDSLSEACLDILRTMGEQDSRIRMNVASERGSFPQCFNAHLSKTTAEFISIINSVDELHPFALLEVVRQINTFEGCDIIYTDEDRISFFGYRNYPLFKPDFDSELLLAFNYLRHLTVLRREIVLTLGGFRASLTAGFEWDLLLRALRDFPKLRIAHVAKPLYHTRMFGSAPEDDMSAGPNERKALMRVLSDHLTAEGKNVVIESGIAFPLLRRIPRHPGNPCAAIVIRCRDGLYQRPAIQINVRENLGALYELIDCVLYREDQNYDRHVISRLEDTTEDVFIFINGSLETVNHIFCEELIMQALRSECGVVGGLSLDLDLNLIGTGLMRGASGELVDPCIGMPFSEFTRFEYFNAVRSVEAVDHRFFAVRREHLASTGGIAALSAARMPRLVSKLVTHAHQNQLRVLVTPYAIATFEEPAEPFPAATLPEVADSRVRVNRSLMDFEQFSIARGKTTTA